MSLKKDLNVTDKSRSENKSLPKFPIRVKNVFPTHRQEILNEHGWGFSNCYFAVENGYMIFKGDRYGLCNLPLKNARAEFFDLFGIDVLEYKPLKYPEHKESDYPPKVENKEFCQELKKAKIEFSDEFSDRFIRCRGQALKDYYILRYGKFERVPDLVVFPKCHEDVVLIVELAKKFCAVIIPYGGGTNTTMSLSYLKEDHDRLFVSLDTTQMCNILWIDKSSLLVCAEAGISGQCLEDTLGKYELTLGHLPDSIELSTLGGWVATRSAGMKQRKYGNIEDLVKKVTLVTGVGVLEKNYLVPRASVGPDFDNIALGSEGTLGVITKVVVKVQKKPPILRYGSIIFYDFESGVNFMYQASKLPIKPSSLRLVDNLHVRFGFAFKPQKSLLEEIFEYLVVKIGEYLMRMDMKKISFATYMAEGEKAEVDAIESALKSCASLHGGVMSTPKLAEASFEMIMTNCYTRDFFLAMGFLIDSIEPSVVWDKCWPMINAIKQAWEEEMHTRHVINALSFRISQIYDNGACVYFYYGIGQTPGRDQFEVFEEVTDMLREVILKNGGCLSHHHGIGKKSLKYYPEAVSKVGADMFKKIKQQLDPQHIFDVGNLATGENKSKM